MKAWMETQYKAGTDMHKTAHYMGEKPAPFTSDKLEKRKSLLDNLTESLTGAVWACWELIGRAAPSQSEKTHSLQSNK